MIFEVCVDSIDSALAARDGGAQRLELCSSLSEGGLTPSLGLAQVTLQLTPLTIFAMLRPRRGDFCFSSAELDIMLRDLQALKDAGVHGFVIGCLTPDGQVNIAQTAALVQAANPLPVTFHRAFDVCADPFEALETLIRLGVARVLTAGQQPTAEAGLDLICQLIERAAGRILILPGSGISLSNIAYIAARTHTPEIHFSASAWVEGPMVFRNEAIPMDNPPAPSGYQRKVTLAEKVRHMIAQVE